MFTCLFTLSLFVRLATVCPSRFVYLFEIKHPILNRSRHHGFREQAGVDNVLATFWNQVHLIEKFEGRQWMWSGTSVAHMTLMHKDLGSILIQIQDGVYGKTLISLLSDNRLRKKFHSFVILLCQVE